MKKFSLLKLRNILNSLGIHGSYTPEELKLFIVEFSSFIDYVESLEKRMIELENQRGIKSSKNHNTSSEYIQTILSRIDILKNLMKQSVDDSTLFSPQLVLVESIENEIKDSYVDAHRLKHLLETLNEIYSNYKKSVSKI